MSLSRRELLLTAGAVGVGVLAGQTQGAQTPPPAASTGQVDRQKGYRKLQAMAATLHPCGHLDQIQKTRETYLAIPNDDLLYGFRLRANQDTPGKPMTGWCEHESSVIFGQIISGLARMGSYLDDKDLKEKAVQLYEGWRATVADSGEFFSGTYGFDKFNCGIVDLRLFAGYDAMDYMARMTDWASHHFDRTRSPGGPLDWDGRRPHGTLEWYTLGENLYRAYLLSGNDEFRQFADVWQYPYFWNKLATTNRPATAHTVHAYSHVNTFCSAAMAYAVSGDRHFLDIITNAYDYLLGTQCFATGGFGPIERLLAPDGRLGKSLSYVTDHAEIGCGSWAAFKLSKYLIEFTGDGKYGDWIEQVYYNCIGASLPVMSDGRTYYYADYRTSGGDKLYYWQNWPCCSGTYIQAVGDYHTLIYFRDDAGLYVNLFVPSEVTFSVNGTQVTARQITHYPESSDVLLLITPSVATPFTVSVRVPAWCDEMKITVNNEPTPAVKKQGWLTLHRTWEPGDKVSITLPLKPRVVPVDVQHPDRCAVVTGAVVLGQEARYTRPLMLANHEEVTRRFEQTDHLRYRVKDDVTQDPHTGAFRPMYSFGYRDTYRMYHDLKEPYLY